jgi:acyl-coenzyme A synthetase/AMP-(fatty) acid ligase
VSVPVSRRIGARPGRESPPNLGRFDEVSAQCVVPVVKRYNFVIDTVDGWACDEPDALALVIVDQGGQTVRLSIGEVSAAARRGAAMLSSRGVRAGDVVVLALPPIAEWYTVMFGAMRIGAIPVTLDVVTRPESSLDAARRVCPAAVIADRASAAVLEEDRALAADCCRLLLEPERNGLHPDWEDLGLALATADPHQDLPEDPTAASDPFSVVFSRGTTGPPRLIMHRHSWVLGHIAAWRYWLDLRPGDLHCTLPEDSGWTPSWVGLLGPWHERAAVLKPLTHASPAATFDMLRRNEVTSICASPDQYRALASWGGDASLPALRHCVSTGAPLDRATREAWRRMHGLRIFEGYGQAETTALIANFRSVAIRDGAMGKAIPGWQLAVHDEAGAPLPPGATGRLVVRCPEGINVSAAGLLAGYVQEPTMTSQCFRDGWYDTGDLVRVDEDGYYWFVGRAEPAPRGPRAPDAELADLGAW